MAKKFGAKKWEAKMGGKDRGWGAARLVPRHNEQGWGRDATTTR